MCLCSHPGYFGKVGMRYFRYQKNEDFRPSVNLDKVCLAVASVGMCAARSLVRLVDSQLWTLVSDQTREKYAENKDGKVPVIDVVEAVSARLQFVMPLMFSWLLTMRDAASL